jgi:hypothetical protein
VFSQEKTHENEGENKLSKKLMLLVALSLAFAAMFMFAGPASAQTTDPTCPPGTTPTFVFNRADNPIDGHFVCVPISTVVTPTFPVVDGFVDGFVEPAQEFSIRRVESGPCNETARINNAGNNVNLSAPVQQVCNTGNVLNEQGVVTDGTGFNTPFVDGVVVCGVDDVGNSIFCDDGVVRHGGLVFGDGGFVDGFNTNGDIDFEGSSINLAPTLTSDTTQTINQAAAAGPVLRG